MDAIIRKLKRYVEDGKVQRLTSYRLDGPDSDLIIQRVLDYATRSDDYLECTRALFGRLSERLQQRRSEFLTMPIIYESHETIRFIVQHPHCNVNMARGFLTPLAFAAQGRNHARAIAMCRLLVQLGADPHLGDGENRALHVSIKSHNEALVTWFVDEHGVQPTRDDTAAAIFSSRERRDDNSTFSNLSILSFLLDHGAPLPDASGNNGSTSLNKLLRNEYESRERKLSVCRALIHRGGHSSEYMMATLQKAAIDSQYESCSILMDSGMDPLSSLYHGIQASNKNLCFFLVQHHGVDPFQEGDGPVDGADGASSPFQAAARLGDLTIFEIFAKLWGSHFFTSDGVNDKGHFVLHELCGDARVSIPIIKLVLEQFHPESARFMVNKQGLYPFQAAAASGFSLDSIYLLLRTQPDLCVVESKRPSNVQTDNNVESLLRALAASHRNEKDLRAELDSSTKQRCGVPVCLEFLNPFSRSSTKQQEALVWLNDNEDDVVENLLQSLTASHENEQELRAEIAALHSRPASPPKVVTVQETDDESFQTAWEY